MNLSAEKFKNSTKYIPFKKAIHEKNREKTEKSTFPEFKYLEKTNHAVYMILASWMSKKYIHPIIEAYINFCQNTCDVMYLQLLYTLLPPIVTIHVHL